MCYETILFFGQQSVACQKETCCFFNKFWKCVRGRPVAKRAAENYSRSGQNRKVFLAFLESRRHRFHPNTGCYCKRQRFGYKTGSKISQNTGIHIVVIAITSTLSVLASYSQQNWGNCSKADIVGSHEAVCRPSSTKTPSKRREDAIRECRWNPWAKQCFLQQPKTSSGDGTDQ